MTHSLHRKGSYDVLKRDYVVLAMLARGINDTHPESRERLKEVGNIMRNHNPVNIMSDKLWRVSPIISAVYEDINSIKELLKELKERDLGISIVVSGLIKEIQSITQTIELEMHTIHYSLGIFGKTELLPNREILELTTMCGHHCISPQSIENYIKLINENKISVEKVANKLAKPCVCGIFNNEKAKGLITEILNRTS